MGQVHALVHWYTRCAGHPVLAILSAQAADILNPLPAGE